MTDRMLKDLYILLAFLLGYVTVWMVHPADPWSAALVLWFLFGIPVSVVYAVHVSQRRLTQ